MRLREKSAVRMLGLLAGVILLTLVPHPAPATLGGLALILLLPGLAFLHATGAPVRLGSLLDLMQAGTVSLALTPLFLRLVGLLIPFTRGMVLGTLIVLATVPLCFAFFNRSPRREQEPSGTPRALVFLLVVTLLLLAPTLTIGPTPEGGETRVKGWDLNNHLAIAEMVAHRGLPPQNPFIQTEAPFYYHTFFHILVGSLLLLTGPGVSSYFCISLLTLLIAGIFLVTFYRVGICLTGRPRATLLALPFVSLVGGFDVVAVLGKLLWRGTSGGLGDSFLEHWNVDGWISNQGMLVPTMFASFYWVPHAVAALCLFLLALSHLRQPTRGIGSALLAGAAAASMAGYNGYIALGGFITFGLLGATDLWKQWRGGGHSSGFAIRETTIAAGTALLLGFPVWTLYLTGRPGVEKFRWMLPSASWPLQVLLEWGPALLLGLVGLFSMSKRREQRAELVPYLSMGVWVPPVLALVASTGENNDLSMRISMLVWVSLAMLGGTGLDLLLPAGGPLLSRRGPIILGGMAVGLGMLSVLWFALGASIDKPALPADEVAAGRWVRNHIPPGRLVQGSPLRNSPTLVYLTGHPAVLSDQWAARLFYSDEEVFSRRKKALQDALGSREPTSACFGLLALRVAAVVVGPPEEEAFPHLSRPAPWPCLALAHSEGRYRVYRVQESTQP